MVFLLLKTKIHDVGLTRALGGAYVAPINPGHLEMLGELVAKAKRQSKDLCVFVVEYGEFTIAENHSAIDYSQTLAGLAPKTVYPQQTIQAAHALRYLIDKVGYSPENVGLSYVISDNGFQLG